MRLQALLDRADRLTHHRIWLCRISGAFAVTTISIEWPSLPTGLRLRRKRCPKGLRPPTGASAWRNLPALVEWIPGPEQGYLGYMPSAVTSRSLPLPGRIPFSGPRSFWGEFGHRKVVLLAPLFYNNNTLWLYRAGPLTGALAMPSLMLRSLPTNFPNQLRGWSRLTGRPATHPPL